MSQKSRETGSVRDRSAMPTQLKGPDTEKSLLKLARWRGRPFNGQSGGARSPDGWS